MICIDLRDSDGALMWQCWACNDHRSISAIRCRPPPAGLGTRTTQPAQPGQLAALGGLLPHESTSSDTVIAVTAACSWCFTRAAGRVSAPSLGGTHGGGQCTVSYCVGIASHRVGSQWNRCLWCGCYSCVWMHSPANSYCTHAVVDCGMKMTMVVIAIDSVGT